MTDSTLNRFLASGTHAERLAFTPNPATPASGPDPSYRWLETDTGSEFAWDFGGAAWVQTNSAGGGDMLSTNNLSDVSSPSTSLTNLGLSANGKSLVTAADYAAMRTALGLVIGTNVQAFDADLDALAALSGTNTIYYRSAANTWTAVTIGANLTFSAGTLAASSGSSGPTIGQSLALSSGTFSA